MAAKIKKGERIFFILLFLLVIIASIFIVRNFVMALISAIVLSYLFYPLHNWLNSKIKMKSLSAALVLVLIIIIIILPLAFAINTMISEAGTFSNAIKNIDVNKVDKQINDFTGLNINLREQIDNGLKSLNSLILSIIPKVLLALPKILLDLFLISFMTFYFLRDGRGILKHVFELLPIKKDLKSRFAKEFGDVTKAIVYGITLSAVAQGVVAGIGYAIFGIGNPILLGALTIVLALIPFMGPAFVYVPASIYLVATDHVTKGILLLIFGVLIVSTIDNVIKPRVISQRTKIHPIIILIGLLGGLTTLGFIGIVVGPLLLSFLILFFKIYREGKHEV